MNKRSWFHEGLTPRVRKLLLAAVLAASVSAVSLSGHPGPATTSSALAATSSLTGTLVFVRSNDLWTSRGDGSNQAQITHMTNNNFVSNPVFSPDGTKIAYDYHLNWGGTSMGGTDIHVMNADGTADQVVLLHVAPAERYESPAWTPDGSALVYSHDLPTFDQNKNYTGDTVTLESLSLTSQATQVLGPNGTAPVISATGRLAYLFTNPAQAGWQLMVTSADGKSVNPVLSGNDFLMILNPRFSPDGTSIVFSASGRLDGHGNLVAGGSVSGVNSSFGSPLGIILPLGIQTAEAHGLPWDAWQMGSDGSSLHQLTHIGRDEQALAWTAGTQQILVSYADGLIHMNPDGSAPARIFGNGDPSGLDYRN